MSRLADLIAELCPEGVEYKPLGELLVYQQPTPFLVSSKDYDPSYPTPVLTAGATFLLGYSSETHGVYAASTDDPVIIFDDFTTASKWVDFPFKLKSSAAKILTAADPSVADIRFLYFLMQTIKYQVGSHARHWIAVYSKMPVCCPPLEVQREIVRILDQFTTLEAELEAELEARRTQYEYYRNQLLSYDALASRGPVKWVKLGDIGTVKMCKRIHKKETADKGDVPFYKISSFGGAPTAFISRNQFMEYKSKYPYPKVGDLLISASGTIGRVVRFNGEDAYFQDSNIVWLDHDESIVSNRFLFYLYKVISWETEGGTIKRLYNSRILKQEIPVPSFCEQQRIADILDRFDALVNDISSGLPAEIAARRAQYEYYRDRLLSFPEKK